MRIKVGIRSRRFLAVSHLGPFFGALVVCLACASAASAAGSPTVAQVTAVNILGTSAVLKGEVKPEDLKTSYHFEYGLEDCSLEPDPCTATPNPEVAIASESQLSYVTVALVHLAPNTVYHYRLVAQNSAGSMASLDQTFTTFKGFGFLPGPEGFDTLVTNQDGSVDSQAGSHPYSLTTTVNFNEAFGFDGQTERLPDGDVRDIHTNLPPGLVGNPTVVGQCTPTEFHTPRKSPFEQTISDESCPDDSQIGEVAISAETSIGPVTHFGIFNLVPPPGAPAAFGFNPLGLAVVLVPHIRSNGDYGLTVDSLNTSQLLPILGAKLTFWGSPWDTSHDGVRGNCLNESTGTTNGHVCPVNGVPRAYLTLPTACTGPLQWSINADSWQEPGAYLPNGEEPDLSDPAWKTSSFVSHDDASPSNPLGMQGCNHVSFAPQASGMPTSDSASSPTGLDFNLDINDEGLTNPEGVAQSHLKKAVVTLPEGTTINPSAGAGLGACTPADFARETIRSAPGEGCPESSKIGNVTIETPLLTTPIPGAVYVAAPFENQFGSLLALYIVAKDPNTGVLVKVPGKIELDPVTGRVVSTFDDLPQLPFSHFNLHFSEGQTAPLVTPPACGTYQIDTDLTPWASPQAVRHDTSQFTVKSGVAGDPCPSSGVPPFAPQVQAGTLNNNAGSYSPLYLRIVRNDGEQEITKFSSQLPPGLTANLSGVPFCPDAAIALAKSKSGGQEEAEPSCPAASQIGHSLVGAGVGSVLAWTSGRLYLAGPYNGAPFSIVDITSAKVGPFDLGTVVVREALKIDPQTAVVTVDATASDPIPHIIDGVVIHVRDIRVYVDRPQFTLNPTNCNHMTFAATVTGSGADFANPADSVPVTLDSPFQAANCQALGFKPSFKVSTSGKTSKANGASLSVKLSYPSTPLGTQANIAAVKVDLPKQLPSRLTTLQKACTAKQFALDPAGCPAESVIGHARAITPLIPVPLEGPAYFVSNGGEAFPNLILVLQGYGVRIDLVGDTFISKAGVTSSTFKTIPDQPVGSFELILPQGRYSALAANGNLCSPSKTMTVRKKVLRRVNGRNVHVLVNVKQKVSTTLTMPTMFTAQNGMVLHQTTPITVTGCPKRKAKIGRRATRPHRKGAHGKRK